MNDNNVDTIFVTYFESNFHDTTYGRGMESVAKYINVGRDISKWDQDNIRLLIFLTANNQANISPTRYNALDKFKSYLYEVPPNVKNSTTY